MGTRFQVTAYGSTVNFASRLEGLADNQQIIISKDVKEIVEKILSNKPYSYKFR